MDDLERSLELDVLAHRLKAEVKDGLDLVEHLAEQLVGLLPHHTTIEHSGGGFFSRKKLVEHIRVDFHDVRYMLRRDKHGPTAQKMKIVRGVALSTKSIDVETWISEIAAEMHRLADKSAEARAAMEAFVFGRDR